MSRSRRSAGVERRGDGQQQESEVKVIVEKDTGMSDGSRARFASDEKRHGRGMSMVVCKEMGAQCVKKVEVVAERGADAVCV